MSKKIFRLFLQRQTKAEFILLLLFKTCFYYVRVFHENLVKIEENNIEHSPSLQEEFPPEKKLPL